ncbi:MAG: Gfo/Idh/MocA family oxidoreductase, partial [Phycisphaerae bacterium]|nr:Gfo/Idh/MocA family oxidoreductase [Phycisphaerae bacterium]
AAAQTTPGADRRIRMGVVGGGFGSCFPWHEHPDAVVAGVSDLIPERREHLMKTFKCETGYESLEKLILAKDIDAVAVFTPAPDHARHVEMVMNAGKHAISAVPLGMDIEECEKVLEATKRTGMTYMMAETSFYRQETITARQWYKEGRFGEVTHVEGEYFHDHTGPHMQYWHDRRGPTWRYGFPPMHYPTHSTAFLTGVTGERITEVACMGWGDDTDALKDNTYKNPFWNSTALCRTNKGHYAKMSVFWAVQAGFAERANWFGTKMNFYMPHPNGSGAITTTADKPPQPFEQPMHWKTDMLPEPLRHDSGHGGAWTFVVHEFVDALLKRRSPAIDIYEALAETVPGIIAHQSALKKGELMNVPQYEPTAG